MAPGEIVCTHIENILEESTRFSICIDGDLLAVRNTLACSVVFSVDISSCSSMCFNINVNSFLYWLHSFVYWFYHRRSYFTTKSSITTDVDSLVEVMSMRLVFANVYSFYWCRLNVYLCKKDQFLVRDVKEKFIVAFLK